MNWSSHEEDIFVVRLARRRLKEEATRRRYCVHLYFNKCGELGSCIAARVLDQMDII
jgi:hypothetical protein